jgi:hypothetical protein
LIITSLSHLKGQRVASRTWMQTKAHDKKNDIFKKTMIPKNMILKNKLATPSPIIVLVHGMK